MQKRNLLVSFVMVDLLPFLLTSLVDIGLLVH